ncbi:YggU family protein [archaeon]|jgi:uncharacterized protein|nr:YggU family protein [archaeon]MBT4352067.1 YggU family protein [archaeon]MBT4647178.1 YggU family protein [archaeon]MBT6822181.1 YggU family protein [archaeon]MBT7391744.1 YggU family protein [archaeon]
MINDISEFIIDNKLILKVKANSSKNEIIGYDKEKQILKVNIKAPAENNKANIEIIKFFKKLTKRDVKIISGLTSKKKILKFT